VLFTKEWLDNHVNVEESIVYMRGAAIPEPDRDVRSQAMRFGDASQAADAFCVTRAKTTYKKWECHCCDAGYDDVIARIPFIGKSADPITGRARGAFDSIKNCHATDCPYHPDSGCDVVLLVREIIVDTKYLSYGQFVALHGARFLAANNEQLRRSLFQGLRTDARTNIDAASVARFGGGEMVVELSYLNQRTDKIERSRGPDETTYEIRQAPMDLLDEVALVRQRE
jgi:hypothetical protein